VHHVSINCNCRGNFNCNCNCRAAVAAAQLVVVRQLKVSETAGTRAQAADRQAGTPRCSPPAASSSASNQQRVRSQQPVRISSSSSSSRGTTQLSPLAGVMGCNGLRWATVGYGDGHNG
jgi:hypothetical protein